MLSDNLETLIINLEKDFEKRENISKLLVDMFDNYSFIDAVYGPKLEASEYYRYVKNDNPRFGNRHILTPSEVGCFLSHKRALEHFLKKSDSDWLLVLEDDIYSSKHELQEFLNIDESELPKNGVIILGGQEGLKCEGRLILSPRSINNTGIRKVILGTTRWLFRTCCYLIHKDLVLSMLDLLNKSSFIIDDWRYIVKRTSISHVYYKHIFCHPIDLSQSLIEKERLQVNNDK